MLHIPVKAALAALAGLVVLAACDQSRGLREDAMRAEGGREYKGEGSDSPGILDALLGDGSSEVKVNRHLWTAALDVLNFLPVESADPFTGVISTGYGTPPGGGRAYRATVLISDPALDARSLNVALQTRSGPVDAGTQRAVEDAILARARQLRIQAAKF